MGITTITKSLVSLPRRKKDSRKGDNGRVLVIGGSPEYIGAVALAGIAGFWHEINLLFVMFGNLKNFSPTFGNKKQGSILPIEPERIDAVPMGFE